MAAGLGFKTFTTGEVLTAADTNGYLMQGVNVFADAAARTAAITSPQEGQMSFLKDTNSTEYYSGSAWVAVSGGASGMTLISTTTLSSSGNFNINGCFSSTYDNYRVIFSSLQGSAASFMSMGLRTGSTNATANYKFGGYVVEYGTFTVNATTAASTARISYVDWGSTTTTNSAYIFDFFNPFKTTNTNFSGMMAKDAAMNYQAGTHAVATSYDSLWFTIDSGTLSGNISIYGLAK
jgi:hypothetical protein